jgi:hypothetical protein
VKPAQGANSLDSRNSLAQQWRSIPTGEIEMASTAPATGRTMSAGRVFERAFAAARTNPMVILGLALLVGAVPTLILTYLFVQIGMGSGPAPQPGALPTGGLIAMALVSSVISMVISAIVQGAITRAAIAATEGKQVSFGDSLATGFRVFLPLIGLAIVSSLGIMLGFVLLIVPGVILLLMWTVAVPALVVERRGVFASLSRSSELTKGAKGTVFGILIVVLIAYWLLSMVFGVIGIAAYNPASIGGLTVMNVIGSTILGTLFNAAWGTIQPALYVELRQWKEGTSVEQLEDVFA